MDFLEQHYELINSENLEDYYIYIGLGYFSRKVALTLKQSVRLGCNEDGSYRFEFVSPLISSIIEFKLGVEFYEHRPDGYKMKSIITIKNNIMTHIQTDDTGRKCIHVREFYPDKMVTTTTADGLNKTVIRNYAAKVVKNEDTYEKEHSST